LSRMIVCHFFDGNLKLKDFCFMFFCHLFVCDLKLNTTTSRESAFSTMTVIAFRSASTI